MFGAKLLWFASKYFLLIKSKDLKYKPVLKIFENCLKITNKTYNNKRVAAYIPKTIQNIFK